MVQSDRSPGSKRPKKGPSRKGPDPRGRPTPSAGPRPAPRRGPADRPAPGAPKTRPAKPASSKAAARRTPSVRPEKGTPPPKPANVKARLKKVGKQQPTSSTRQAKSAKGGDIGAPVIQQTPAWKRLLAWLLEDPSKAQREGPTEREKALQVVAEQDRLARRELIRSGFRRKRGARFVEGITLVQNGPGFARPPRAAPRPIKPKASPAHSPPTGASPTPLAAAPATAPPSAEGERKVFPLVALWHKVLGEERRTDRSGNTVVMPPAETDWRWNLHRFFRSNVRGIVYARHLLLLFLVLSSAWVSLYATTGYDYFDLVAFGEPEDPRDRYKLPFFVIESGSMMHPTASWGRVGTLDPGDIVVIEKHRPGMEIQTFYGDGDREVAGARGDVIMFLPVKYDKSVPEVPIIHRAIAHVQRDQYDVANPDAGPGQPRFRTIARYTVEEFGIVNAESVTIPELGLWNYRPPQGGYLTRGDNPRSNNWADQGLGVTPYPVPEDRIIGRMKAEVPVIGLAKIALSGQDQNALSVDEEWCSFLAGKAACDTWVAFFIVTILVVGLPLAITSFIFGRRLWQRSLDRMALQRRQAEEVADIREAATATDDNDRPRVVIHDATDLLTGKVAVGPARPPTPRQRPAEAFTRGGLTDT